MKYDTIVIGAGLAGLVAATRLAEEGQNVLVLAAGVGSTHLAPGTIDVLGFTPDRVESPSGALPEFVAAHSEHPYAGMTLETMAAAVEWLKRRVRTFDFVGTLDRNMLLPTAIGALKPSAIVPETMAAGDLAAGGRLALAGLAQLKDFYPAYAADNLDGTVVPPDSKISAQAVTLISAQAVTLRPEAGGAADVTPLSWVRLFEDSGFRSSLVAELAPQLDDPTAVGLPAVLGLAHTRTVWQELQDGLGVPVFEIPTLPPSVPGMRTFGALKSAFMKAGGSLVIGARVTTSDPSGPRVTGVVAAGAGRPKLYEATAFVLASGGFSSGGLEMDSYGRATETVFGLPVAGVPPPHDPRFDPDYWAGHPMGRAGVAVDARGVPVDEDGAPLLANVCVAGASLAGAQPWLEQSGDGISLTTGYRAAQTILDEAS